MIESVKVLGIIDLTKTIDSNDRKDMINNKWIKNMTDNTYKVKIRKWIENVFGHEIIIDSNSIIIKREQHIKREQITTTKSKLLIKNIRIKKLLKKIIRIR